MFDAKLAQERLRVKGLYVLKTDGDFGRASWAALLAAVAGRKIVTALDLQLGAAMAHECPAAGIASGLLMAHFVAQGAAETGGFGSLTENLNYSTNALVQNFGRHRISIEEARMYGRNASHAANQEMLANILYGGIWGVNNLGNSEPGDGWRYRGRGLFQLTGRSNYSVRAADTGLPLVDQPDLAADPATSVKIACKYWSKRNMAEAAARDDLATVRLRLNGGSNGLEEARTYLKRAKAVLL